MKDIHINDIPINGYYITSDNPLEKILLESQEVIDLRDMNLTELVLPHCKELICGNNELTKLIFLNGCEHIRCASNRLTKLVLPKDCKYINCQFNILTKLIVPKNIERIFNYCNLLHPIINNLLNSKDPVKIELANNMQFANNLQNLYRA
jgi:hypothetical protein